MRKEKARLHESIERHKPTFSGDGAGIPGQPLSVGKTFRGNEHLSEFCHQPAYFFATGADLYSVLQGRDTGGASDPVAGAFRDFDGAAPGNSASSGGNLD